MGRVINTASTGKQRNQLRRTIAELLRRLSQKQDIDDDTKNMVAMIALCLREIDEGIDDSVRAWEKRGYWIKADQFRQEWMWVRDTAKSITKMIHDDNWAEMPMMIMQLIPSFSDVNVAKLTRTPDLWANAYGTIMSEK
ncbi:MAG: hypothetical protein AAF125_23035 [Chloroflexota bacterium]